MRDAALIILGYVLGSVPFGYWLPLAVRREDIRKHGSGNTGAANVWRTFGFRYGLAVALLDIGKGLTAALLGRHLGGGVWVGVAAGVAAMLGHYRPLFFGFRRGGKVVATTGGVGLALAPLAALGAAGVWIVVFAVGRYSSLASILSALSLPALAWTFGASWWVIGFTIGASLAILVLHRANIVRLAKGQESRFTFSRRQRVLDRRRIRRGGGSGPYSGVVGSGRDR